MIRVKTETGKIEIEGHAGYGKNGEDIVCAGISALSTGVLLAILESDAFMQVEKEIKSGYMCVRYKENPEKREVCQGILKVLERGTELIAEEFPDNVRIG